MMKMPLLAALGLSGEVFLHIVVKMTGRAHEVRTALSYIFVRILNTGVRTGRTQSVMGEHL